MRMTQMMRMRMMTNTKANKGSLTYSMVYNAVREELIGEYRDMYPNACIKTITQLADTMLRGVEQENIESLYIEKNENKRSLLEILNMYL